MAKAGLSSAPFPEGGNQLPLEQHPLLALGPDGRILRHTEEGRIAQPPICFLCNYFIPEASFQLHNFPERTLSRR